MAETAEAAVPVTKTAGTVAAPAGAPQAETVAARVERAIAALRHDAILLDHEVFGRAVDELHGLLHHMASTLDRMMGHAPPTAAAAPVTVATAPTATKTSA